MHPAECLLHEALTLARQELGALHSGQDEDIEEMAARRASLINQALEQHAGINKAKFKALLDELQKIQTELTDRAENEYSTIHSQLVTRKKQSGYFNNAYTQRTYSDKSFYMNKIS